MKPLEVCDRLYSFLIRHRDNWTCVLCGKSVEPGPTQRMQNSHFWSRSHKNVRYDGKNCDSCCAGCHMKHEHEKQGEYKDFKIKQLGEIEYERLRLRAFTTIKFGRTQRIEKIKELMQRVREEGITNLVPDSYLAAAEKYETL